MSFDPNGYIPRALLTWVALVTGIAPFLADWNETHIYNPNWPGHAKFHNGQTMSMGACLGIATLWKTYWANDDRLLTASVFASLYYVTMASAILYPDATAYDPPQEFSYDNPQMFILTPLLTLVGVAYWLEQRRTNDTRVKKA